MTNLSLLTAYSRRYQTYKLNKIKHEKAHLRKKMGFKVAAPIELEPKTTRLTAAYAAG